MFTERTKKSRKQKIRKNEKQNKSTQNNTKQHIRQHGKTKLRHFIWLHFACNCFSLSWLNRPRALLRRYSNGFRVVGPHRNVSHSTQNYYRVYVLPGGGSSRSIPLSSLCRLNWNPVHSRFLFPEKIIFQYASWNPKNFSKESWWKIGLSRRIRVHSRLDNPRGKTVHGGKVGVAQVREGKKGLRI